MDLYILTTLNSAPEAKPLVAYIDDSDKPKFVQFQDEELRQIGFYSKKVITFSAHDLIDCLRHHKLDPPSNSVDLLQMYKLYNGKPIKYHRFTDQRILWSLIVNFFDDKDRIKELLIIYNQGPTRILLNRQESVLLELTVIIKSLHIRLTKGLQMRNELQRFETVEQPLNNILLKTQYNGIKIDMVLLSEKIEAIENDIRQLDNKLRFQYNLASIRNQSELKATLKVNGYQYLERLVGTKYFWRFVKPCTANNEFLTTLFSRYKSGQELSNLMKIAADIDSRIFPIYDCNGSVTSRVLVRRPHVQQLKRGSRDIFLADENHSLVYVDYGQFEPSIVASETGDDRLIQFSSGNDLYLSLSEELFETPKLRELCKVVLLSFIYGMSDEGIRFLIKDYFNGTEDDKSQKLSEFFLKFEALIPYKKKLENLFLAENRIGTLEGNYRYVTTLGGLKPDISNLKWILSQRIQGTASLILKKAILASCADVEIKFMFPMHDAALFQVPSRTADSKTEIIKRHFKDCFSAICPRVTPKVNLKKFHK